MARKLSPPPPIVRSRTATGQDQRSARAQPSQVENSESGLRRDLGAVRRTPQHYSGEERRQPDSPRFSPSASSSSNDSGFFGFSDNSVRDPTNDYRTGSLESTAVEGQELYLHFFHEQLQSARLGEFAAEEESRLTQYHIPNAHVSAVDGSTQTFPRVMSMNLENFQNRDWRNTGRDLQRLADAFARSHERILVQQQAQEVDITSITREKFLAMLNSLFEGGQISRERVLVLFFFCSDLAILAVRNRISGLLVDLTSWSLVFIREKVCAWVHQNGGWGAILNTGMNVLQQAAVISACVGILACCYIYLKKNL